MVFDEKIKLFIIFVDLHIIAFPIIVKVNIQIVNFSINYVFIKIYELLTFFFVLIENRKEYRS